MVRDQGTQKQWPQEAQNQLPDQTCGLSVRITYLNKQWAVVAVAFWVWRTVTNPH
jgi:hypothetical protein